VQFFNWFHPMKKNILSLAAFLTVPAALCAATVNVEHNNNPGGLRAAVIAANPGDVINVGPGTYWSIISSNKTITIKSTHGAAATIIDGGNTNRCATLALTVNENNTVLAGFTLTNGNATTGNMNQWDNSGGGVLGGTLDRCILTHNTANDLGGGACGAVLNNCLLTRNTANNGGGAAFGVLNNCTVSDNTAEDSGGGVFGIINMGPFSNPVVVNNSIVWGNTPDNDYNASISNSFTNDPFFAGGGDYRLQPNSPCIGMGNIAGVVGALDLDGRPRTTQGKVDMGAYEFGAAQGILDALRITDILLGGVDGGLREIILPFHYDGTITGVALGVRVWSELGGAYYVEEDVGVDDNGDGSAVMTFHIDAEMPGAFFRIESLE